MIGRALLLATSLVGLTGCVAAAAIPVLAGGSMLRSDAVAGSDQPEPATQTIGTSEQPATSNAAPRMVVTELTELPAPGESDIRSGAQRRVEARSFDDFYGYALTQASLDPLEAPMRSALLENPGSLEAVRQDCGPRAPVVIVDLDPQGSLFDLSASGQGSTALGEVLAVLRSRGIAIAWTSGLAREAEADVRARLESAKLDPTGSDRLLLIGESLSSKQDQRSALAETHCPIAIAGDAREDFDELFAYLKNPEAAIGLDEMFGAGWFLTPNPID